MNKSAQVIAVFLVVSLVAQIGASSSSSSSYSFYSVQSHSSNEIHAGKPAAAAPAGTQQHQQQQHKQINRLRAKMNNLLARQQVRNNQIGTGLVAEPSLPVPAGTGGNSWAHAAGAGLRRGFLVKREVESPAQSVDSGGHPNKSSLTGEIAKLLHMKPGYYSEVYDKLDSPGDQAKPQDPADAIEEMSRQEVARAFELEQASQKLREQQAQQQQQQHQAHPKQAQSRLSG